MKRTKMLRVAPAFVAVLMAFAVFASVCGGFTALSARADGALTAAQLLSGENWINLPGYEYVRPDVKDENGAKYPAEVAFSENADGVGINMKVRGYYQSLTGDENGNGYAGIVLREKVEAENFSITFTINKLGASSSASPADDGWVGVALLQKPNLFHSANTSVNSGAIALLRTANRSVNLVMHEVASDGAGGKVANFSGSPTPPSAGLDLAPATEGATLRYSIVTETSGSGKAYYGKIEQIDFATGNVIASKQTALSLLHPEWYLPEDGKLYLALSASTDNFDKQWDISIKNICGVEIGRAADTEPISAAKRAENINKLIETLKIYEYFELDGSMRPEGEAFYSPASSLDIDNLTADLATQLYGADAEVLAELTGLDAVAAYFDTTEAYLAFLNGCKEKMIENYEEKQADSQIAALTAAVGTLPPLQTVSLVNERETYAALQNVIELYFRLGDRAVAKMGQAEYDKILNEVILVYEEKLGELSVEKYLSLSEEVPESVTLENAKEAVFAVVPAESLYKNIEERVAEMEGSDYELYTRIMTAKAAFDTARTAIDALKEQDNRTIESYENGAKVRNDIFYLPDPAGAEHAADVFAVLVRYSDLARELKNEITAEERTQLLTACKNALSANIAALPEASEVTAENYLTQGYDLAVSEANNRYNLLDEEDSAAAEAVEDVTKLRALVRKLAALTNPLSASPVEAKTVKAGETITLSYGDMFRNYYGRTFTVTADRGTADNALETYTVSFDQAGEYTVEVTVTDTEYGQSAVCRFTVTVTGTTTEKKGCGCGCNGALSGTNAAAAGVLALVTGILALAVAKRRKQCR